MRKNFNLSIVGVATTRFHVEAAEDDQAANLRLDGQAEKFNRMNRLIMEANYSLFGKEDTCYPRKYHPF